MLRSHRNLSGAICLGGLLLFCTANATAGKARRPITRPGFDPTAERVALFDGMDQGQLESRVVAKNAAGGAVYIKNLTDQPLTVELPEAFVAVQVNKQFGGAPGGGAVQSTGGGFGGGGGGGGGFDGGGGFGGGDDGAGFFSIPPEQTVRLSYDSVCLNHGKPEPSPRTKMEIVPVESYTSDKVLAELLSMVGTGRLPTQIAQAAVWTRTDKMTWRDLANKVVSSRGRKKAYFHPTELRKAQLLVSTATGRARERAAEDSSDTDEVDQIPSRVLSRN